jgi:hypothetical protein
VHRQRIARQREEDNQRRAQERTMRLLSHLRQQEIERKRRYRTKLIIHSTLIAKWLVHPMNVDGII